MPRQPLSPSLHRGPWTIGPGAVDAKPEHIAIIGKCMTLWPDVLHQMALLLGILLGVKSEAAVAVFSTIRNARARREAIAAAAEYALDDRSLELLSAITKVVEAAEAERDSLAHGCYGTSQAIEDGILWVESKHLGPWNVSMLLKQPDAMTGTEHAEFARHIFVYKKSDLEAIHQEIHYAWKAAFDYHGFVRWEPGIGGSSADQRYRQLCNQPRVAQVLSQIRLGKQNRP